jgi:hypothetical protein
MGIGSFAVRSGAGAAALVLIGSQSASASVVSVGVGGDTNWGITTTVTTSTYYPRLGSAMSGNVANKYSAHFLGLPVPVTGYIISSFPYMPFSRPTDLADNVPLASTTYAYTWDSYLGKYAWTVHGSQSFWGSSSLYINGTAKADTAGATGYFHGGSGTGHGSDANARNYVKVS